MRFYNQQHPFYCGIDLHTRKMYSCIVDQAGQVLVHRNLQTRGDHFLNLIAPYRNGLVVGSTTCRLAAVRPPPPIRSPARAKPSREPTEACLPLGRAAQ